MHGKKKLFGKIYNKMVRWQWCKKKKKRKRKKESNIKVRKDGEEIHIYIL